RLEGPRALAAVQRIAQPEVVGREAEEPLRGPGEETLARTVEEPEPALVVEGEDGDVDLVHDLPEQRRRLERAEPLLAQRLTERVDFTEGEAERVVIGPRARGPERVVAFEERGKEVRQRLDRADHAVAEHGHERPPADDDEERQRPPDPWLVVTEPEEGERDDGARRAGQEREERDVSLIAEAPSAATGIGIGGWHHRFRLRRSRLRARPRPDHGEIPYCWSRRYNALRLSPSWSAARLTFPPCRSSARRIRCFSTSSSVISSRRTAAASVARGR